MDTNIFKIAAHSKISTLLVEHEEVFIAYSGGLDSHVLLHLLADFKRTKNHNLKLTAIHINHNLNPNAAQWVVHCQKVCADLDIRYITKDVWAETQSAKHSLEEVLRNLRYGIFAAILPENGCLLTAHQANDQAETLLLQLFRGAGPKGLAAMAEKTKFATGWLVRPLLNFHREELLQYALQHKFHWIEDESNADTKFDRNLIRHQILPMIRKRWLGVDAVLGRVAGHCAETDELLGVLAKKDLLDVINSSNKDTLNVSLLKNLTPVRQKNILRFWLHQKQLSMPSEVKLNEVIRTVINSRYDAMPVVKWVGAEIHRFQNNLYAISPLVPHDNSIILPIVGESLVLPSNLGTLKIRIDNALELDPAKIMLRFRQGGEKIKFPNRSGSHDLKDLMREWKIPPWLRDRIPLVYYDMEIIAVVGYYSVSYIQCQIFSKNI